MELILAIFARLTGLSGVSKFLVYAGLAVAAALCAASVYATWHHEVFKSGYDRALLDIARADGKAIERASSLRDAWSECHAAGRTWDQANGVCQ